MGFEEMHNLQSKYENSQVRQAHLSHQNHSNYFKWYFCMDTTKCMPTVNSEFEQIHEHSGIILPEQLGEVIQVSTLFPFFGYFPGRRSTIVDH